MFICSNSITPRYFFIYVVCLRVKMALKGEKIIVFHP